MRLPLAHCGRLCVKEGRYDFRVQQGLRRPWVEYVKRSTIQAVVCTEKRR